MPEVTVIISTYNRSNLVREAIESVLQQSFSNFEVFVVDDGSTDDTRSVVESIKDDRVRYFYEDNKGQSCARNLGLLKANGRFIAFLDSDDLWPPNYIETMLSQLDANKDYGVAYARVIVLYPDGREREIGSPMRNKSGWITEKFFSLSPCLLPSATFFRKSVWEGVFWDEVLKRGQDYDLFLRISTKTIFLFVPDMHVVKRWHKDSLTKKEPGLGTLNGARSLERFYFYFGGDKYVPLKVAKRKISHRYRKAAMLYKRSGKRRTAIKCLEQAIYYRPLNVPYYVDLIRTLFQSKKRDKMSDRQTSMPLPPYITVSQKRILRFH